MSNFRGATSLIGGGFGALDAIDGAVLNDKDGALVISDNKSYIFRLDEDSAVEENSPLVISPDANAGDKRWVLGELVCRKLHLFSGDIAEGQLRLEKSTAGGKFVDFKATGDGSFEFITSGPFWSWDGSYPGVQKQIRVWNESTVAGSGMQFQIYTQGDAAGDPVLRFKINPSGGQWLLGIDNSDDDKFKISAGSNPETNTAITIDLSLNTVFAGIVDAINGFKDNGVTGIDGTFVDKNSNTITVSGGIITNLGV